MFICQFFNGNPNFEVTSVTKVIKRVQVNNENGNPRDQDRELFIFSKMYMIHVYMLIFQWESKFWGHKGEKFHIKGPGEQWEWIFEKKNYYLSLSLGLPFSLFTWTLNMAFVTLVTSKFGFSMKNWHINMYHMHVWKIELLPVLVPGVAILFVHLDPQYFFCHPCNPKIRILIEKLAYKHVSYVCLKKMNYSLSWSLGLPFSLFTWTLDMEFFTLVTSKFGFPLKN